uniref:Ig-like domain-containing protein n=1 Tax=Magallana gigas TaxID=29159 RepID=K1RFL5_MAGGI
MRANWNSEAERSCTGNPIGQLHREDRWMGQSTAFRHEVIPVLCRYKKEIARTVSVGGRDVKVKSITLKDEMGKCKESLPRKKWFMTLNMMLCIRYRKEQNRECYERLPLLPKHVIRVRQYGSTIALSVEHTYRKFNKVVWEKDGTKLKSKKKKFDIDHDLPRSTTLILHDVTEKDSAIYQCILRSKNDVECSDLTSIEFNTIKLNKQFSKSKAEENKKEIKARLMHQPTINPSSRHRNVVKYNVIVSKEIQTTDIVKEDLFARSTETDIRRILHYGVLLSENSRLHWQALSGHSVVNKIYQRFHNTNIRSKTSREYQKSVEHINRKFNKVNWERDGTKLISRERKFDIDHDLPRSTTLVLHDVTEKDSGTYQCFLRFENEVEYSDPTLIGIFARTTETDIRRILHHGVLLSENSRLHWQALNGHSVVNKINQRFHNTNIRSKTSREYQKKCANIGSLQCTDRHVTFISGDVEYLTLCSYLENGCITNKLEALLESRNLAIIKKYFQKNGYIPNANEKCICVPKKYFETIQTD